MDSTVISESQVTQNDISLVNNTVSDMINENEKVLRS
jgi:hypothetical protein